MVSVWWSTSSRCIGLIALVVVALTVEPAVAIPRVTFDPGALTPEGDVDYSIYDLSSPQQGTHKRNATRLWVQCNSVAYYSEPLTRLDAIEVTVVDHFGVRISRGYPTTVTMSLGSLSSSTVIKLALNDVIQPTSVHLTATGQRGVFQGITLSYPPAGRYRLDFRAIFANHTKRDVLGTFEFVVLPHYVPRRMEFLRDPPVFSNDFAPLSQQPMIRLADAAGNTVTDARANGVVVVDCLLLNSNSVVPANASGHVVPTTKGIASFTALYILVPVSLRGRNYTMRFTYTASPQQVSMTLQLNVTLLASYCNTTALSPVAFVYPTRGLPTDPTVTVSVRGGVFFSHMVSSLRCRFGTSDATLTFIDECNINCTISPLSNPAHRVTSNLSVSLDDGATFSEGVPIYFLGADSALTLQFDDRWTEGNNTIELNPFGNTSFGALSAYVVDGNLVQVLNYSANTYNVALTCNGLAITGGSMNTILARGVARFTGLVIDGFPVVQSYTFHAVAINPVSGDVLVGSRTFALSYARTRTCEPPPVVLRLASSGCYGYNASNSLALCGFGESHPLTVYGQFFGLSGAKVYIGQLPCTSTVHDKVNVGTQLNAICDFPNVNTSIMVVTASTQTYVSPGVMLYMNLPVNVSYVVGCPVNVFPSTAGCFTNTTTTITVFGSNFGRSGAIVLLVHQFSTVTIRCVNTTHSSSSPTTQISCTIPVALGFGLVVTVRNAETGQLGFPKNYAAVNYLASTGVLCLTDSNGFFCSQRGTCFLSNGTCNCQSSASIGYWTGDYCQQCIRGYYGPSCKFVCPSCVAGNSLCDDGVSGSGLCVCYSGWGGSLCSIPCPGGASSPCNNHGRCDPSTITCSCYSSATTGYWSGASCSQCAEGWSGGSCTIPCPYSSNRVCGGHGVCQEGTCKCFQNYCDSACNVSFAGCSGCVAGAYGKNCSQVCPGGINNICNGNGFCSDGPFGNGLCTCDDGYGGVDCTVTCPHGPSNPCSGHGACEQDTGVCTCYAGYTLSDCSRECPGGATNPCNKHGTCDVRTSTCSCSQGWSGAACDVVCPGGVAKPCNLHGICVQATSTCQCYKDVNNGFWDGAMCDTCATDWWGRSCNRQCAYGNGLQCGGHGQCSNDLVCGCYASSTTGFWSGTNCSECAYGYFGPTCTTECPGSACNPCYGKGNCSQGVQGTGLCSCDWNSVTGYWTGVVCDACANNWFGVNCTKPCPIGLSNLTCSGRGTCNDGLLGSGTCSCFGSFGGSTCAVCAVGYWGPHCANLCPGLVGKPCLGRGVCNNTESADGLCACFDGYGGSMCQYDCPLGPYGVCNGQGVCILNSAGSAMICVNCSASATTGFWTGAACDSCASGYFGSHCTQACPGGSLLPCNNRGTCMDGYFGTGECVCTAGYAGLSCEKTCNGGALVPCSGHGVCDGVTGQCSCYSSGDLGYWVNAACDTCNAMYTSSSCTVQCPTDVPGSPCSGHGTCFQGVCVTCDSGYCGRTCSTSAGCLSCPAGTWGSSCKDCSGGRATPCSNHGTCLEGMYGSGDCICHTGYRGANCSVKCPGPEGVPCYGRGLCSDTAVCSCTANWAGSDCNTPCNGYNQHAADSVSCSGVGKCNKFDGSCSCIYGFGGSYCQIQCPQTNRVPCTGNGFCEPTDGTCSCYGNSTAGYWNGTSCNYCRPGYFGSQCIKQCVHGYSDVTYTKCVCEQYWSGQGCDIPCPGLLNNTVCNLHGVCDWGRDATAKCTCETNWYDGNCQTYCTKGGCDGMLVNGQCNVDTGLCECQFDSNGHWDYTTYEKKSCEVCNIYFFGQQCESPCACNRHGRCDRRTGVCSCYADAQNGYWSGSSCAACADGYIGVRCQNLNVAISPLGTVAAVATVPALDVPVGIICNDPLYPFKYLGTSPVTVLSPNGVLLSTLQLGGFALSCFYRSSRELYIFTYSQNRILLNVINRVTSDYLRTEYLPLASASGSPLASMERYMSELDHVLPAAATSPSSRRLSQFDMINSSSLSGALMMASTILAPITGATPDLIITPYGYGVVQFYSISTGTQLTLGTGFAKIIDAQSVVGLDGYFSISGMVSVNGSLRWEVVLCPNTMPLSTAALVPNVTNFHERFGDYIAAVCQTCLPSRIFVAGDSAVLIFSAAGVGMYLAKMSISATPPPLLNSTGLNSTDIFVMTYFYGTVCDVTATTIDDYAATGYFAMTCNGQPSVIMKFTLKDCFVTGIINMAQVGADVETVVRMSVQPTTRTLEALTPLSRSQRIQIVSLFAVSSLSPLIADTKGGTHISITGEGFIEGMRCVFNGETVVSASFVDQSTLVCVAPAGGTVSCAGETVEVSLPLSGVTNNGLLLQRVASAAIRTVISAETGVALGFLHGGVVTVIGSGFVEPSDKTLLHCNLYTPNGGMSVIMAAKFVSSYEVLCITPAISQPMAKPSYLEVSIDGTVFSDSLVAFDVIGNASTLFISSPTKTTQLTVRASSASRLPPIHVEVADSVEHPLGSFFDSAQQHNITASLANTSLFRLGGELTVAVQLGVSIFNEIEIINPTVGTIQMYFVDAATGWTASLSFDVVEGEPYRLYFARVPSTSVTNDNPTLSEQPVVGILDSSGNALSTLEDKSISITTINLFYTYHDLSNVAINRSVAVPQLNAKFRVEGVSITGKHQQSYYLIFAAPELPVPTLTSPPIVVGWCLTTHYAVEDSAACNLCPANARCDGTFNVEAQEGWWRADNTTLQFYSCGSPFSGDSCANNSRCVDGYHGPRCSLCNEGYGRSGRFCVKCNPSDTNSAIVVLAIMALLTAITLMVYSIVMTTSQDLLPVLFRNMVTYIQVIARLSDTLMTWPPLLDDLWRTVNSIASLQAIDFSPFECAMQTDFFHKYVISLVIPWVMVILVAPLAIAVVKYYSKDERDTIEALEVAARVREEEDQQLLKEMRLATAQRRVTMIGEISRSQHNPLEPPPPEDKEKATVPNVLDDATLRSIADAEASQKLASDWTNETLTRNRIDHVTHILRVRTARYTTTAVIVVTAVTIFTLLYPTLVQSSGQVLRCEALDLGRDGVVSVSSNQRDVRCDSNYYETFRKVAISMIMLYGVGIPCGLIAVVLLLRRIGGIALARAILAFTMAGFKPELWFWESVNMGRKFMAMFVVVFVTEAKLQMIVFMWVVVVGFVLNVTFEPYTNRSVYLLESLSMAATVVTLNLVLLFFFLTNAEMETGDWRAVTISAAIIVVNVVTTSGYMYSIVKHAAVRLWKWRDSTNDVEGIRNLVVQRVANMGSVVSEVDGLRLRRQDLDNAIELIEHRLEELDNNAPEIRTKNIEQWKFPGDEVAEVIVSSGSSTPGEDAAKSPAQAPIQHPTEDEGEDSLKAAGRRATVTFAAEEASTAPPAAARKPPTRTLRSLVAKHYKDFTIASQHELVRRFSSSNDWVEKPPEKNMDESQIFFDADELIRRNFGDDDEDDNETNPILRRSTEKDMFLPSALTSPKANVPVAPVGLTADVLRKLNQDEPIGPSLKFLGFAPPIDDDGRITKLDPRLLTAESSSSSDNLIGMSRLVAPPSSAAVALRVENWQQEVCRDEASMESPGVASFTFDHHFKRDEEAEVEFLEGVIDEPPPPLRSVYNPEPEEDRFNMRREMSLLDKEIAQQDFVASELLIGIELSDDASPPSREVQARPSPLYVPTPSVPDPPRSSARRATSTAWGVDGPPALDEATPVERMPTMGAKLLSSVEVAMSANKSALKHSATPNSKRRPPTGTSHGSGSLKPSFLLLGASESDDDIDDFAPRPILQNLHTAPPFDFGHLGEGLSPPPREGLTVNQSARGGSNPQVEVDLGFDFLQTLVDDVRPAGLQEIQYGGSSLQIGRPSSLHLQIDTLSPAARFGNNPPSFLAPPVRAKTPSHAASVTLTHVHPSPQLDSLFTSLSRRSSDARAIDSDVKNDPLRGPLGAEDSPSQANHSATHSSTDVPPLRASFLPLEGQEFHPPTGGHAFGAELSMMARSKRGGQVTFADSTASHPESRSTPTPRWAPIPNSTVSNASNAPTLKGFNKPAADDAGAAAMSLSLESPAASTKDKDSDPLARTIRLAVDGIFGMEEPQEESSESCSDLMSTNPPCLNPTVDSRDDNDQFVRPCTIFESNVPVAVMLPSGREMFLNPRLRLKDDDEEGSSPSPKSTEPQKPSKRLGFGGRQLDKAKKQPTSPPPPAAVAPRADEFAAVEPTAFASPDFYGTDFLKDVVGYTLTEEDVHQGDELLKNFDALFPKKADPRNEPAAPPSDVKDSSFTHPPRGSKSGASSGKKPPLSSLRPQTLAIDDSPQTVTRTKGRRKSAILGNGRDEMALRAFLQDSDSDDGNASGIVGAHESSNFVEEAWSHRASHQQQSLKPTAFSPRGAQPRLSLTASESRPSNLQQRRSTGFSRFRRSTLTSGHNDEPRPISPILVDWDDDDF